MLEVLAVVILAIPAIAIAAIVIALNDRAAMRQLQQRIARLEASQPLEPPASPPRAPEAPLAATEPPLK